MQEYINLMVKCFIVYFVIIFALRIMGKREVGELSVFDTEEETKAYARKKGIGKLYIVGEDITIVDIGGEKA